MPIYSSISLASLTLPAVPPSLVVQAAAESGFDAVGINLTQLWRSVSEDPRWFTAEIETLSRELDTHQIGLTHGGHLLLGNMDRKAAAYMLAAMHQLGTRLIPLIAAPGADASSVDSDFEFIRNRAEGKPLMVEFAGYTGWRTLSEAMGFLGKHADADLRLVVDVLHLVRSNSVMTLFESTEWPVGLIQLSDAPLHKPQQETLQSEARGNRLDVGEGTLPLVEILSRLPTGIPVEIEAPSLALRNLDPLARARRSFDHLAAFLQRHGEAIQKQPGQADQRRP